MERKVETTGRNKKVKKGYDLIILKSSFTVRQLTSEMYSFIVLKPLKFEIHHLPYSKGLIYARNDEIGISTHEYPVVGVEDLQYEVVKKLADTWLKCEHNDTMKGYFATLDSYYTCVYKGMNRKYAKKIKSDGHVEYTF